MFFTGGTQQSLLFKPLEELTMEMKNIQALNIKGLFEMGGHS